MVASGVFSEGVSYSPIAYSPIAMSDTSSSSSGEMKNVELSPFFQPSDPRKLRRMSTPGGTVHLKKLRDEAEHKSTIAGASANLIVYIVGAGMVGIPYALKEAGLVAGVVMVVFCAAITEKSLRLLIETAKHIDVPSYEVLYEASFGHKGFIAMSLFMFSLSYGSMISYMMIMKDTLSDLMGIDDNDHNTRRAILAATTMLILFPLSVQRDMADLAMTSKVSVVFYCLIVAFVIFCSPVRESVQANGGWKETLSEDVIRPPSFFTGLGVLIFAYVCQHSSFILAGSLKRPTKQRWSQVTGNALLFSGMIYTLCGVIGYLGFLADTDGNFLNNFDNMGDPLIMTLCNGARAALCVCMFFVYPMDAFVTRHVCIVLLFEGRRAHEGDDHAVLARRDRRIILTFVMISITLLPALLLRDLGVVLAITGSIAGSFLSYIGPGTAYLAIHGEEFLKIVKQRWTWGCRLDTKEETEECDTDLESPTAKEATVSCSAEPMEEHSIRESIGTVLWFVSFMPLWIRVARIGQRNLELHFENEAQKSPHPSRLGKVVHHNLPKARVMAESKTTKNKLLFAPKRSPQGSPSASCGDIIPARGMPRVLSEPGALETKAAFVRPNTDNLLIGYGSISSTGKAKDASPHPNKKETGQDDDLMAEDDPQDSFPNLYDFFVAIGYVLFGFIAMCVGLISMCLDTT